jgi:putative hydrolase of the HAD superfamily
LSGRSPEADAGVGEGGGPGGDRFGPLRAVISDFGGVLTTPLVESFAAYQRRSGITPRELGEAMVRIVEVSGRHPLHELERGRITEERFLRELEEELGGDVALHEFQETYFEALDPNEEMIALMRDLRRRGYRMALLTNNVREWEARWRAMLPDIDEIFEVVVDSAFVGMRKPEHGIYELTVERLGDGLSAEQCVFVDDVEVNCLAAEELGMRAVHFRDTAQAAAEVETVLGDRAGT